MDMDEKVNEELTTKITRSRARHLRRKRLLNARRAAGTDSTIENNNIESIIESKSTNTESKSQRTEKNIKTSDTSLKSSTNLSSIPTSKEPHHKLMKKEKNLGIDSSNNKSPVEPITIKRNEELNSSTLRKKVENDISNEVSLNHSTEDNINDLNNPCRKSIITETKMDAKGKTREMIKAEREARKLAKAAGKTKGKVVNQETDAAKSTREISKSDKVGDSNKSLKDSHNEAEVNIPKLEEKLSGLSVSTPQENQTANKSKAELRSERRAKQESQRAAKQDLQEKIKTKVPAKESDKIITNTSKKVDETAKTIIVKKPVVKDTSHEISLFKHLYHERQQSFLSTPQVNSNIHPAIVRLGVQYKRKVIVGSNARCIALLAAVSELVRDFERPSQADFTRGLEASLQESSSYLHHCRPLAVSMHNALRHLKWQMTQFPSTISDEEAKTKLRTAIDTYIKEQIQLADQAISDTIQTKISNDDVILTYGYSSLIQQILCDAHEANIKFRVVVVDGRPWLEGKELLRRLAKCGIECSYVLINALSFIMPEVSKVFLGAHAILANGAVMSRAGTAQVSLMAKAFNVPVLVACETHKSCERVQTDSIVYNEIGDANDLTKSMDGTKKTLPLINWKAKKSLNLLNITYDVTPADLVTAVVTELAILPCTSVPVILRIKPSEI